MVHSKFRSPTKMTTLKIYYMECLVILKIDEIILNKTHIK